MTEDTRKYMEGHPNEKGSSFCGRKTIDKFSYCPLHLMIVFQPKGKKEDLTDKDNEVPKLKKKLNQPNYLILSTLPFSPHITIFFYFIFKF